MPNKAILQLPSAGPREPGDATIIVRSGVNYQLEVDAMTPPLNQASATLSSAQVLDLHDTPVNVVANAPSGMANIPVMGLVQFSGGTTDYATNTELVIGSASTVADGNYNLFAPISDRSDPTSMAPASSGKANSGDALAAYVRTGNPTAGDSALTITIWYQQIQIA